jgi:peroxiredoxin
MSVKIGDMVPDVTVKVVTKGGSEAKSTKDIFSSGKKVLFAVPGAFTPTCSDYHLPGYVVRSDDIKAKGVDEIFCISVNDAFVMAAWGEARNIGEAVTMLADGNGDFAKAMGLELDGSGFGLGLRSQRYAAVIEDGIITHLNVEAPGAFEVSSAESILALL